MKRKKIISLVKLGCRQIINQIDSIPFFKNISFSKPSAVVINITHQCNLRCKQCNVWKTHDSRKELSTEEWEKVLFDLKKEIGALWLIFSGGEPFIRKDIIHLVNFASQLGMLTNIVSNGSLIDEELTNSIINSNLDSLMISLDGITPQTHDFIRGVSGTYERTLQGINYITQIKNKKLSVAIVTIITRQNIDEIIELIKWVKKMKLPFIRFQALTNNFWAETNDTLWYKNNNLWPEDFNKVKQVIDCIIDMKRDYPIGNSILHLELMKEYFRNPNILFSDYECGVGKRSFGIDAYGDIFLCFNMNPIGNIREANLGTFLNLKCWKERIEMIKKCKKSCMLLNCNFDEGFKDKLYPLIKIFSPAGKI